MTFDNFYDHFNSSDTRTFKQRYWVNNNNFIPETGPVFLYLCGEWTCAPPDVTQAAFALGYTELNASLVVLEHRYYGDSQLFTGDDAWTTENLTLLTTPQALADTAWFID
jgi:hypothetical protein